MKNKSIFGSNTVCDSKDELKSFCCNSGGLPHVFHQILEMLDIGIENIRVRLLFVPLLTVSALDNEVFSEKEV